MPFFLDEVLEADQVRAQGDSQRNLRNLIGSSSQVLGSRSKERRSKDVPAKMAKKNVRQPSSPILKKKKKLLASTRYDSQTLEVDIKKNSRSPFKEKVKQKDKHPDSHIGDKSRNKIVHKKPLGKKTLFSAPPPSSSASKASKPTKSSNPGSRAKTGGLSRTSLRVESKSSSSLLHGEALLESVCREVACEGLATSGGYCRLHYIKNWRKIKRKETILREKKLNQYIEELVLKYPDKYIEAIRQDLSSDKDFAKVIYDLDLEEGIDDFDVENAETADSLIDTIRRDFDDETEPF